MTIKEHFDAMDYGPAPEGAGPVLDWLDHGKRKFGHFIGGVFTKPGRGFESRNPATGEVLARITQATSADVDAAVAAARKAQREWWALGGHGRARMLYALARGLQKHSRFFAVLETLDNGKPIRESRDIDIPLVQRHFYHHAGFAELMETALPGVEPLGVCGQIIPWNFPLLMLAWKVAPALAMGNTVVLKPAEWTSLTALRFAELCEEVALPKGVVNIVTGDGTVGEIITLHSGLDKIAFTGSTEVGRAIRRATAGTGRALTLELGGKSPYIVFDDADIDSAIEGLVDAIWFNQGQVCCAGSRLIVQEGIEARFHDKLRARMDQLRIGDPLDKCIDIGAIVDPVQRDRIDAMVRGSEGQVYRPPTPLPNGCFYPPTLITGLDPASRLMQEEIFGPVLVSTTFRTPSEAVALANNTRYGLAASVWTENLNLALDIAPKLAAGVVWVNATNLFDAAAGFGGVRESGFGREGGWEGLAAYTRARGKPKPLARIAPNPAANGAAADAIDRTHKLYIGGKQARPDGGFSHAVWSPGGQLLGEVSTANRKDLRNAVEAAGKAQPAWAKASSHLRAQILYFLAENLAARGGEFADRIRAMTGASRSVASEEVETSVRRLFSAAAWADKYDGRVHGVPIRGVALAMNEAIGKIGIFAPDEAPLLGFISVTAPAIAMGNAVVVVASEPYPLSATDFVQVLETSDVPPGAVNILTGSHEELAAQMAGHADLDAVWSFSSSDLSRTVELEAAGNLKRTWVNHARARDWSRDATAEVLAHATQVKNIWVPYGE